MTSLKIIMMVLSYMAFPNMEVTNHDIDEIKHLSYNVYHETRGEPTLGKIVVAQVTRNRVFMKGYPHTYKKVVWQKKCGLGKRGAYKGCTAQFSWTWDGRSDKPRNKEAFHDSVEIAALVYFKMIEDKSCGATHYYNPKITTPSWIDQFEPVSCYPNGMIGNHRFMKERED